jgi:hypothetical protein
MTPHASLRLARTSLWRPVNGLAGAALLALATTSVSAGFGCSKNETPPPAQSQPGGGGSGGTAGGATDGATTPTPGKDGAPTTADVGSGVDTQPASTTCAGLRNCVTRCAADTTCQQKCSDAATAAAKAAYATVTTCSKSGCDFNDELCRCQRECMGDGACVNEVDECRSFDNDLFCEVNCGS